MHADIEGLSPEDAEPPIEDAEPPTEDAGLSTAEARARLLAALATPATATPTTAPRSLTAHVLLSATLSATALLVATGAYTLAYTHGAQGRGGAQVAAGALVACLGGVGAWAVRRDARLADGEVGGRLRMARLMVERWTGGQAEADDGWGVWRDGAWRSVPVLLLAAGDLVRPAGGLPVGVAVRPARGRPGLVVVVETPLGPVAGRLLGRRRACSLVARQIARVLRCCVLGVLPLLLAACVLGGALAYALVQRRRGHAAVGLEMVGGAAAAVLLPFAGGCALWPAYWRIACSLGSARAVALFDALRRSTTSYEDTADIDEFDVEALPPTKDVHVGHAAVARRMLRMWRASDGRNLSRATALAETLGSVTVICAVDREGTLAGHVRGAEQVVVPAEDAYDVLDLDEPGGRPAIIDPGWQRHLPALRGLALACALRPADATADARRLPRAVGLAAADLAAYQVCARATAVCAGGPRGVRLTSVRRVADGSVHVLADGDVGHVLAACLDYFDGSAICALDDERMAAFHALHQNALLQDLQCLAFAYRPGDEADATRDGRFAMAEEPGPDAAEPGDAALPAYLTRSARVRRAHEAEARGSAGLRPMILLGLVTFAHEPKTDVCDVIEDLSIAGIRFVYFSPLSGRQSKAFAERLGLETDWNTCILLSSGPPASAAGYVEDHDIKARLPRGIDSIRPHLADVDDIPLQISLFAEAAPEATREMVGIFQENGDIVCCIAGALGGANTLTFAAADLAVAMEPRPHLLHAPFDEPPSAAAYSSVEVAAALTCLPCPLFLQHDTSLYTLLQVISEARRLVAGLQLAATLLCATALAAALVNLVSCLCLLPPALESSWLLWILWLAAPFLALSLLFAPPDDAVMSTMPLKNLAHVAELPRFALYAAVRAAPAIALTVAVYATALRAMVPGLWHADWLALSSGQQASLWAAQSLAAAAFVFHLACVSATMMHRTRMTVEYLPFRNRVWVVAFIVTVGVSVAVAGLVMGLTDAEVGRIPWYSYVLALPAPVVLLPLQDLCKMHDRKRWTRLQKLAKLEFNTKLGLHSPL
ncbi:hypothetical protein GGI15_002508 [Coemansia interrupta]|uniref:Cation-transporting P-type ATPase C-terminal domain-containing protein n=1 Tax=Coemansia interrupta TaxID=1126814 RepID=A0A9W8HGR3_9FUNG|nr:hypothetical protein GGI15_002508 [Coemansia interrupta]